MDNIQELLKPRRKCIIALYMAAILTIYSTVTHAQRDTSFHVSVICNPDNNGEVNPRWANNYVVVYTLDSWMHRFEINWISIYGDAFSTGEDTVNCVSVYEYARFTKLSDAVLFAKKFKTSKDVGIYEAEQYKRHLFYNSRVHYLRSKMPPAKPKIKDTTCCKVVKIV